LRPTALRHIDEPGVVQADRLCITLGNAALIELRELAALLCRRWSELAVEKGGELARSVVVAMHDEGRLGRAARIACVLGHHPVTGRLVRDEHHARLV